MHILFPLVIIINLFIPHTEVLAQSSEFSNAYSSYNTAYDSYRSAQSNYEIKRGQYLASQTVASKGEAQTATYNLLQARDEAISQYLNMLNKRMVEAVGISNEDKQVSLSSLDTEVQWYQNHKSKLSSGESLDDLIADSDEAKNQYNTITQKLIYKTLGQIAIGKESYLRAKQTTVIDELNNVLGKLRQDNVNTQLFDRGVLDIGSTVDRSIAKNQEATTSLEDISKKSNPSSIYPSIISRIQEGVTYLKQANSSLKEIVFRIMSI